MAEHKLLGIIVAVGLVIVGGIFAIIEWNSAPSDSPEAATVAVVTPDDAEPAQQPAPEPTVSPTPLSGKVVVSKRPVEVLAAPSESASAMFGFPAGRPFRVLGGDGKYVKIKDIRSGASGWIEEAALAPAPAPVPAAKQRGGTSPKPAARASRTRSSGSETVAAEPKPAPKRERPKPFGGLFGGLFGGR